MGNVKFAWMRLTILFSDTTLRVGRYWFIFSVVFDNLDDVLLGLLLRVIKSSCH